MKKTTFLVILALSFLMCVPSSAQWLSTNGNKIVKNGNPITLRGTNFGNWLVWEGYMMNIDVNGKRSHTQIRNNIKYLLGWDETKAVAFQNNWRNNYITEADFQQAKARGYNVIRIPFHYNEFWTGSALKNDGFTWLDKAVQWATNHQIYVIFCLHAAPGCQNPDYHSDNTSADDHSGPVNFWSNWDNVNIAGDIWRHIAYRYKDNTYVGSGNVAYIAGYELLNEPVLTSNKGNLKESYKQMAAKIRQYDTNHLVFVEGNYWGSDFYDMLEKFDSKMVWAAHYYGSQGEGDPNPSLGTIKSQADGIGVPLVYTEFGENTATWTKAARIDYETSNVGWLFWAWKRQTTDRALYSWNSTSGWDIMANYIKYGGTQPSVSNVETWLNEIYTNVRVGNCTFQSALGNNLRPGWPTGSVIWLQNNGTYVNSQNGASAMTCNSAVASTWEKFTVVDAGDWKIALQGNNGRYVNSQNGAAAMTCNSVSIAGWEAFEWVDVNGQVALKGFNGKFVSSEGGASSGMYCNRETVSGWEAFTYATTTKSGQLTAPAEGAMLQDNVRLYPNPLTNGQLTIENALPGSTLLIYTLNGQLVKSVLVTETFETINLSGLASGLYSLILTGKQGKEVSKLVIP
ncbi:MAG: cellulase family glycosylhydrolase [Breznakibacter sp.]